VGRGGGAGREHREVYPVSGGSSRFVTSRKAKSALPPCLVPKEVNRDKSGASGAVVERWAVWSFKARAELDDVLNGLGPADWAAG
jgi:hypothetical protein